MKKTAILTVMAMTLFYGCMADMQAAFKKGALSQPPSSAEVAAAADLGCPVAVSAIHGERNFVKGIDVMVTWRNIGDKTIKYCDMQIYLVNAVGDRMRGEITGQDSALLRFTGPLKPSEVFWGGLRVHKAAIYHTNATEVHIEKIWVEYMDGTRIGPVMVDGMPSTVGLIGSKHV